jgi:hypothetical protein
VTPKPMGGGDRIDPRQPKQSNFGVPARLLIDMRSGFAAIDFREADALAAATRLRGHYRRTEMRGSRSSNRVRESSEVTATVPRCALAISRTTYSPSPRLAPATCDSASASSPP